MEKNVRCKLMRIAVSTVGGQWISTFILYLSRGAAKGDFSPLYIRNVLG
jgi:hypothetical protein